MFHQKDEGKGSNQRTGNTQASILPAVLRSLYPAILFYVLEASTESSKLRQK